MFKKLFISLLILSAITTDFSYQINKLALQEIDPDFAVNFLWQSETGNIFYAKKPGQNSNKVSVEGLWRQKLAKKLAMLEGGYSGNYPVVSDFYFYVLPSKQSGIKSSEPVKIKKKFDIVKGGLSPPV